MFLVLLSVFDKTFEIECFQWLGVLVSTIIDSGSCAYWNCKSAVNDAKQWIDTHSVFVDLTV